MQPDTIESVITAAIERAIPAAVERYLAGRAPANAQGGPTHVTVPEAAHDRVRGLGCSERQVWRLISLKQLKAVKLAGKTMIEVAELERYKREAR